MNYQAPTYDEYCKASTFAKLRYRFGVFIQSVAFILLLLLLYYTISNIEEMKTNPVDYAEEKMGVICIPPLVLNTLEDGSNRNIKSVSQR